MNKNICYASTNHLILNDNLLFSESDNELENEYQIECKKIRDKWLTNLTNITIPQDVVDILSLGEKFNFKCDLEKKDYFDLLNCIQTSLHNLNNTPENSSDKIRRKIIGVINKHLHNKTHISHIDKIIDRKLKTTKKFIKDHPHLIFTRADKGNSTVINYKNDYNKKIEAQLMNKDAYIRVKKDPLNFLINAVTNFLLQWDRLNVFEFDDAFREIKLNIKNTVLALVYGLIKIHKYGFPIRIIVAFINSPLYNFDKCLTKFLQKYIKKPSSSIKNSLEIKKLLSNNIIPEDYELASLDVVAMFPSIPHNLVLEALDRNWEKIENKIPINKLQFLDGINFLLNSTYIKFNNKFYKQKKGLPMGFCSSPFFCELVMDHLEKVSLEKLKSNIVLNNFSNYFSNPPKDCKSPIILYKRYVDDIFLICNKNYIKKLTSVFNSYNENIQFTIENENKDNNSINFLDIKIFRNNNSFAETNWYRKDTFSARYINFFSHHPIKQKIAIIFNIIDKCILLADNKFHHDNINTAKLFLMANNYPLKFTEKYINKRLAYLTDKNRNLTSSDNMSKNILVVPFYKHMNNDIIMCLKNLNISVVNKITNKLNSLITLGKDKIKKTEKNNVIYKIKCKDCDFSYIGQTSRKLYKRVNEHKKAYKKRIKKSIFHIHRISKKHKINFNFKSIKILDSQSKLRKRLFSEMLHIHDCKFSLNKMQDTQNLKYFYKNTVDLINNRLSH